MQNTGSLLRLPAVITETGKRKTAIYEDIAAGRFPAPVRIGRKAVAWRREDLDSWRASLPFAEYVR